MEAVEVPEKTEDVRLLLAWDTAADQARSRRAGTLSIAVHIVAIVILFSMPREVFQLAPQLHRTITPLVFPPKEPTQREPNTEKVSKSFNVESLLPRQQVQLPASAPSTTRPRALVPPPTPVSKPSLPAPLPEPPKVDAAIKDAGQKLPDLMTPAPAPPPQIQPEEKPKLAFETPGGQTTGRGPGEPKMAVPSTSVADAMRSVAAGSSMGGGIVVGDLGAGGLGGVGAAINQSPAAGRRESKLQLLSDPMGADFRPYLLQILQTVRRNWFAVMPESAKLGRRGTVLLQFAIAKDGTVTKVVVATSSSVDPLDRAAIASISMSNPFPPLPMDFRGNVVRLQLTFAYNNAR
jgi:TonB family protein